MPVIKQSSVQTALNSIQFLKYSYTYLDLLCCLLTSYVVYLLWLMGLPAGVEVGNGGDGGWSGPICLLEVSVYNFQHRSSSL